MTKEEETLLGIWRRVLANDAIDVTDNFFAVGGDSILSIEVTSLARREGLKIDPHDVFETATVRSLMARAREGSVPVQPSYSLDGPSPLLPIHHWLVENQGDFPDHWNMSRTFELPERLGEPEVRRIVEHLLSHHDALRGRIFERAGVWWLEAIDAESQPLEVIDLSRVSTPDVARHVQEFSDAAQRKIRPRDGKCTRFVMFKTDESRSDLLLMVAHHAVVDVVSWRILQQDLDTLCRCVIRSEDPHLPPRSSPLGLWGKVLYGFADSKALLEELPFWEGQGCGLREVPRDRDQTVTSIEAHAATSRQVVPVDLGVLNDLAVGADIRIHELLLAAVTVSLSEWMKAPTVMIGIESHGRQQDLDPSLDLSRTVGWLTSTYPLLLSAEPGRPFMEAARSVRDQLRQVPGRGLGYGVLRYLSPDPLVRNRLAATSQPEILFNFLGTRDRQESIEGVRSIEAPNSQDRPPDSNRPATIEFGGSIADKKLQVDCRYSRTIHESSTITHLLDRISELIFEFESAGADRLTQSGSADAVRLSEEDFQSLMRSLGSGR